jgi:hypothetical protein
VRRPFPPAARLSVLRAACLVAIAAAPPRPAAAQGGLLGDIRKSVKRRTDETRKRLEDGMKSRADRAADSALRSGENTVKCAVRDRDCIRQAKQAGKQVDTSGVASGAVAGEPAVNHRGAPGAPATEGSEPGEDEATSLADALLAGDTVNADGILFDRVTGRLMRPESRAALATIGDLLTASPDLRLTIVARIGGPAGAANREAALARAAAVRAYLVDIFGVEPTTLFTLARAGSGAPITLAPR